MEKTIRHVLDVMLLRREHSVAEIRIKLLRAGYIEATINTIIADYQEKGYISNVRYVEEKTSSLMRRGYGPGYVKQLLSRQCLSFDPEDYDWEEALQIAMRKAGSRVGLKLKHYLYRRGFVYGS